MCVLVCAPRVWLALSVCTSCVGRVWLVHLSVCVSCVHLSVWRRVFAPQCVRVRVHLSVWRRVCAPQCVTVWHVACAPLVCGCVLSVCTSCVARVCMCGSVFGSC